jgi:hypothetical protein
MGDARSLRFCLRLQPELDQAGSRATRLANCHNWPAMLAEHNDCP